MSSCYYRKLRSRIIERYGSQEEFAKAFGISKNSFSLKMNRKAGFSQEDIVKCCELLNIKLREIGKFFFADVISVDRE